MKHLSLALMVCAGLAAGCGDDDGGGGTPDAAQGAPDAGTPDAAAPALGSAAEIQTYLEGKTWKMEGDNIPSHPNGYNEDVNFGSASQCYASVTLAQSAQQITVTSTLGTIQGAGNVGETGTCDHTAAGAPLMFMSNAVLIENVQGNGECFDFTVTYTGFGQEGRGKFSADGKTMTLELFFTGQAQMHRCANGAVGAAGVQLNGNPFAGNAQQVYELQ